MAKFSDYQVKVAEENYPLVHHIAQRLAREFTYLHINDIVAAVTDEYLTYVMAYEQGKGSFGAYAWHLKDKAKRRILQELGYVRVQS